MKKLGLILEGGDEGPNLAAEEEVSSPVGLVTAIWNHAPKMEKAFAKEGIQWPNFLGSEMADLVAYIIKAQHE